MGLKSVIEGADNVPGELKDYYIEKSGKFVLDLEDDVKQHPSVLALSNAYRKEQDRRKELVAKTAELETRLSEIPEGFSAEEYLSLKANAGDPNDPNKKKIADEQIQSLKALFEQQIANINKKHAVDDAAKDEAVAERDGYIDRLLIDTGLKDSLLECGVQPELLDGALASLKPSVKVHRSENGDRKAVVETDMGEADVRTFVNTWAQSKGKAYLGKPSGPDAKGGNHRGGGAKTIGRAEFDKLDPAARSKAIIIDKLAVVD